MVGWIFTNVNISLFFFLSILGCIGSSCYGEFVETGKVVSICLVKWLPQNALVPINGELVPVYVPTVAENSDREAVESPPF